MSLDKLGLKCGIEVHQQLEGRKLFCSCPTKLRDDAPNFEIRRKLRASAGEEGRVDLAAKEEQAKNITFVYQGYKDTTCLVETDSEPPHELDQEHLYTSLQLCKLVKASISPVIQVMRKTVVDGSNTSGFQRTALVGRKGSISTSEGEVGIDNISLEEDSGKIVDKDTAKNAEKIFRLDRLGIPLIEIGTSADIKSSEQCLETAKKLGLLLRSLPATKRGLGTIRQDCNVSIKGGTRVEIKGAQELRQLPLLVELEAKRQAELLKIKEELQGVRLNQLRIINLTSLFSDNESKVIQKALAKGGKVLGIKLHSLAGMVGRELQPNYRVGSEFSGRAKIKAGVEGIFHSDELPNYGIAEKEIKLIRKKLECSLRDAFILVAEEEQKGERALQAVYDRAQELIIGIPKEVRRANPDGTTSYLRTLPGAARMYPETDVPLIYPTWEGEQIKLPELLEQKIDRYQQQLGLSKDLAEFAAKSDKNKLFEQLTAQYPQLKPAFIAETLTSTPLDIKRQYNLDGENLSEENFRDLFKYLAEGKIHKDIVLDVLIDLLKGTFNLNKYASLGTEHIHQIILEVIKTNKGAPFPALMGLCMKQLAGKASGQFIAEELKRILEQGHN